ncbi:hypothetical protein [Vitiosangium sp. GDMCC 1.1324]|uniref:hypothetical protein n=1 Tax=Vitiosangium sp. (strain GDMCC 1.1324) TaxID=2138576 RepID=UPI000D3A12F3|nr:hypothetical protein [Vitiosangium sp. GDMCC 1.1324]PTL79326.1 hypothetical protein DAT35_34560 [Vitiosangium sp. GDMCC 1.1324]
MKTLALLTATCALTLWGCAHESDAHGGVQAEKPPMTQIENPKTVAQLSRMSAPTVYVAEPTGAPGNAVLTGDGQIWAPEEAPGNTVLRTPTDVERSFDRHTDHRQTIEGGKATVIDEGPTASVSQR